MTPSGAPKPQPDVAGTARLAMSALHADGILIVDDRGAPVVAFGDAPSPPRTVSNDSAQQVDRSPCDRGHFLSTTLLGLCERPAGALHVRCSGDGPADREPLLRTFARHIGLVLTRHGAVCPDSDYLAAVLPWEALDRLPDSIEQLTARVSGIVRPLVGATAVGITVWERDRRILRALPGAFGVGDSRLAASVTGPITNMLSAGTRVFVSGQPYLSNDAGTDPGVLQPYVRLFRIRRILSVPLTGHGQRVGVLHLVNKPADFTPHDLAVVEGLAPQLTTAVALAHSVERMVAQRRLEGILSRAAVAIASGAQVEDCLLPAFDELGHVTGASVVALVPKDAPPLVRRSGPRHPELERRLVVDARDLPCTSSGAFPHDAGDPGWAALHAPVELHGERTATLSVLRRTGKPFTRQEGDVVGRLARLVALAWATERYQRQLAEIARLHERERIAAELHDRVAQILYAAQLGLDSALENTTNPDDARRIVEVRDLLVHGDATIRDVIHRLDPVADPSLTRRLLREVESVEEEFDVVIRAEIDHNALSAVPRSVADAAVRVAREGMVNAAKHAGPCRIRLEARTEAGDLVVAVLDDGLGIRGRPAGAQTIGLRSLRRSAEDAGGSVVVTTPADGFGTQVTARFPT